LLLPERTVNVLDSEHLIGNYEVMLASGSEMPLMIRINGRRIMGEDVTDHGLLDVSGLSLDDPLDESALARAVSRVLASSADGPSNSFSASI
jgi:hypothetical protein